LFTTVDNSISADRESAAQIDSVGSLVSTRSADISRVMVQQSLVTFLAIIENSIAALMDTSGGTSVSAHSVTVIAILVLGVNNAVSATREDTVISTTSIAAVGVERSKVAFFVAFLDTITTV
jgi:hypothetical protein